MQEKHILTVSILITALGLLGLFFYADDFNLKQVEEFTLDEEVKLTGIITKQIVANNTIILEVSGEKIETNTVIFFPDEDIQLEVNDYVQIQGSVTEYKGKKEIIADSIILK